MRKIFATLKSVVAAALVVSMTLAVSCSYDDTAVKKDIKNLKGDLAELTERVNALENNESIKDLLDGAAVITDVTVNETTGDTVITLSNGETVTVLAEGLQYRVTDGVLEISADGQNWVTVTAAPGAVVKSVVDNEDGTFTITLADETQFTVAKAELIECEATRTGVYVLPETTKAVNFTINDAVVDINVMNQPLGWSATVEEYVAPVLPEEGEDDELGGGVMPLAAGGKEYVLNITAPAKDFAQAAKEGVVSVHFNTAAGACKVMKVAVNLAEVTLVVENGVVTLTNSVAFEQTNRWGETYTDFADFAIGVMEASAYEQYGDSVFADTFDDMYEEYIANVAFTHRTSGFQNIVDLMLYEDGTCEKESYTFSVEQLAQMFYPIYNFELGGEYIIFVTLDTELVNRYEHPVLANALMVDYKNTVMTANYVSSTSNGAVYEFNLAGYTHYILGWVEKQQVDMYIGYGVCSSLAEFLSLFAGDMGGIVGLPGTMVAGPFAGTYNLAELAAQSMANHAPEMSSDTEYYFYIYPLNIESENDIYADVDQANVFEFGTFETTGLVAGDFDAITKYEVASSNVRSLVVNAYFNEDVEVIKYAYEWFEGPALDEEERIASMLENANFIEINEYNTFVEAEYSSPVYPAHLGIIVVNAAGEYVYEETVYEFVESYNFEIEFTSADFVDGVLKFQGADANDYLDVIMNPGLTSIVAGEYAPVQPDWFNGGIMPWSSADALEFDGSNSKYNLSAIPAQYGYYLTEYGKMTVALEGDVYTIVITDLGYIDSKYQPIKFTYTGKFGAQQPVEPEQPVGPVDVVATSASARYDSNNSYATVVDFQLAEDVVASIVFRTGDGGWDMDLCFSKGLNYINAGQWNTFGDKGDSTVWYTNVYLNGNQAEVKGAIEVGYADGAYSFTFRIGYYNITYTGAVEGLVEPEVTSADLEQPDGGEVVDRTGIEFTLYTGEGKTVTIDPGVGYCAMDLVDAEGKNYIRFEFNESGAYPVSGKTYTFSPSDTSYNFGTLSGNGVYVGLDGWVQAGIADYGGIVPTSGTITVSSVENDVYTFVLDFVLPDGSKFGGTYVGALPF